VKIRTLTERDARDYWKLRLDAFKLEPGAFEQSAAEHEETTFESTPVRLQQKFSSSGFVLGAFVENRLIGIVGFARYEGLKTRHRGCIWELYVRRPERGQGIGKALLLNLLRRAEAHVGLEQLTLTVEAGNTIAMNLYSHLGFSVYGRQPHALKVGDEYVDQALMVINRPFVAHRDPGTAQDVPKAFAYDGPPKMIQ
jgi:RimJ/RimL family protein N-acetyltransferase